ncbi:MAG: glycosyltransferase family 4 protein [Bacteroidales bacterium]|jgi:glycosyltransferase involved in cell wall biosynthesis|nr:glycosyltransferase family 4 protein [Bacteroidales bacterium]
MISICHITTVHKRFDVRIFHKECTSLRKTWSSISIIVADGLGDETRNGITIYDIGKPKGRKERFLNMTRLALKKAREIKADIYHLHDPELLRIANKLRASGVKIIFDAHEDLPRQIASKPYIPRLLRKPIALIVEWYENKITNKIEGIITATPFIKARFIKINKNTIDINNFPLENEIILNNKSAKKENKVCYIGGITKIRGIAQIIEAIGKTNLKLDLAGDLDSKFKSELKTLKGWQQTNYLGFIDRDTSLKVKSSSIAGIVSFLPVPNHINAQPNKIFEYMASGIPVIGSNFPLWKLIIEDNQCGICVNPENPEEIAAAINTLVDNPRLAKEMGENGKRLVNEKYNWHVEEEKLFQFYKKLIGE